MLDELEKRLPEEAPEETDRPWKGIARLRLASFLVAAAMLAGIEFSRGLWIGTSHFPTVPTLRGLSDLPPNLTPLLTGMLAGLWIVATLCRLAIARYLGLGVLAVLVLFDQNRLQPWVYQYALMFGAFGLALDRKGTPDEGRARSAWALCALIVAFIYFWSGLQKANAAFGRDVLPWLLEPAREVLDGKVVVWVQNHAHWASATETAIGVFLLLPWTRLIGVAMALGMHSLILLSIGPWGHDFNSVVWPWNLAMMALVVTLFFRMRDGLFRPALRPAYGKAAVLLVVFLPTLSFVNRWDDYLSASLYSGRMRYARFSLSEADALKVAKHFGLNPVYEYTPAPAALYQSSPGIFDLDVTQWSYDAVNVPAYPEIRYLAGLGRRLIEAGVRAEDLHLYVSQRPHWSGILQAESEVVIR